MKRVLIGVCGLILAAGVYAESKIEGSAIINKATVVGSANVASGRNAEANQATIKIQDSQVKGSAIVNEATVVGSANVASGRDSEANQGSVVIK